MSGFTPKNLQMSNKLTYFDSAPSEKEQHYKESKAQAKIEMLQSQIKN